MDVKPFNVREHAQMVLNSLQDFRESQIIPDFKIKVGDSSFPVHRVVLAACSDYFRAMLRNDMKEARAGFVAMKDVEADAVKRCIDFMYTGEAKVTLDNVDGLLHASNLLQLLKLTGSCFAYLQENLSVENCIHVKDLAQLYDCKQVIEAANQLAIANFPDLIETEGFCSLGASEVKSLVAALNENHEIIWHAVEKWITVNESRRRKHFHDIFESLKLEAFPLRFVLDIVWKNKYVKESKSCKQLVVDELFSNMQEMKLLIDVKNCFTLKQITKQFVHENSATAANLVDSFMIRNFKAVAERTEFVDLDFDDILSFFQSDQNLTSAQIKWFSALKWVRHAPRRECYFPKLLKCTGLAELPHDFIKNHVRTEPLVRDCAQCNDIMVDALFAKAAQEREGMKRSISRSGFDGSMSSHGSYPH